MHAPERPGSSQYHAPSSAFTGHSREREPWYGSSCGPSPPAVTLKSCRRVSVTTLPLSDLVAHCCGARGDQKAPEGGVPRPRAPRLVAVPRPVRLSAGHSHRGGTRVLARLFERAEPHPQ